VHEASFPFSVATNPHRLAVDDINGDDAPDIVVVHQSGAAGVAVTIPRSSP
jgi:hypothetical protein